MQGIPSLPNCIIDNFQIVSPSSKCTNLTERCFFLTHFHCNHYKGLHPQWKEGRIFCSKVTAKLLINVLKFNAIDLVCPVDYNETIDIGNVKVTFLDANHCAGSVMLLFQTTSSGTQTPKVSNYLYSGDMKYTPSMKLFPTLHSIPIDNLFIDTSYAHPKCNYYSMKTSYERICSTIQNFLTNHGSNGLILFTGMILGREDILQYLWNNLPELLRSIYFDPERTLMFSQLTEFTKRRKYMTEDSLQSRVHIYSKTFLKSTSQQLYPQYESIQQQINDINHRLMEESMYATSVSPEQTIQHPIEHVLLIYASGWAENMHLQSYYTSTTKGRSQSMDENVPETNENHNNFQVMSGSGMLSPVPHTGIHSTTMTPLKTSPNRSLDSAMSHIKIEIYPHVTHSVLHELQDFIGWLQPATITPLVYNNEAERIYFQHLLQKCIRSSPSNKVRTLLASNTNTTTTGSSSSSSTTATSHNNLTQSPTIAAAILKSHSGTNRMNTTATIATATGGWVSSNGGSGKVLRTTTAAAVHTPNKVRFETTTMSNHEKGTQYGEKNSFLLLPPPILIGPSHDDLLTQQQHQQCSNSGSSSSSSYAQAADEQCLTRLRPAPLLFLSSDTTMTDDDASSSHEEEVGSDSLSIPSYGNVSASSTPSILPFAKISLRSPMHITDQSADDSRSNTIPSIPSSSTTTSSMAYASLKTPRYRRPHTTTTTASSTTQHEPSSSHTLVQIPEDGDEEDKAQMEISEDSLSSSISTTLLPSTLFSPLRTTTTHTVSFDFTSSSSAGTSCSSSSSNMTSTSKIPSYSDTKGKILKQLRISALDIPTSSSAQPVDGHNHSATAITATTTTTGGGGMIRNTNPITPMTPMTPITPISIHMLPGVQHGSSSGRLFPPPWISIPPIHTGMTQHPPTYGTTIERSYSADYAHHVVVPTVLDPMVYRRKVRSGSGSSGGSSSGSGSSSMDHTLWTSGSSGSDGESLSSTSTTPSSATSAMIISYPTAEDVDEYWSCQYCTFSHYGKATALLQHCSVCHTPRNALHNTNTVYSTFLPTTPTTTTTNTITTSSTNATPLTPHILSTTSATTPTTATTATAMYDTTYPFFPSYHHYPTTPSSHPPSLPPQPQHPLHPLHPPILSFGTVSSDLPMVGYHDSEEGMMGGGGSSGGSSMGRSGEELYMRSLPVETVSQWHDSELFTPDTLLPHPSTSASAPTTTTTTSSSSTHLIHNMLMFDDALRTFSAEF